MYIRGTLTPRKSYKRLLINVYEYSGFTLGTLPSNWYTYAFINDSVLFWLLNLHGVHHNECAWPECLGNENHSLMTVLCGECVDTYTLVVTKLRNSIIMLENIIFVSVSPDTLRKFLRHDYIVFVFVEHISTYYLL